MKKFKLLARFVPKKYRNLIYFILSAVVTSGIFFGNPEVLEFVLMLLEFFTI